MPPRIGEGRKVHIFSYEKKPWKYDNDDNELIEPWFKRVTAHKREANLLELRQWIIVEMAAGQFRSGHVLSAALKRKLKRTRLENRNTYDIDELRQS